MKAPDLPNVDVKEWQKQAEVSLKSVQSQGHRAVLVSVGCVGIAVDLLRSAFSSTTQLIGSAERRGERLEQEMKRLRSRAQHSAERVNREVVEGSQMAEKELERQAEQVRSRIGIPSRDRVEKLSVEIDELSAKIDQELTKAPSDEASTPIPGYDGLNAEMLVAKLQTLDNDSLVRAQAYEREHKHRVTVMREIDRLLFAFADEAE